MSFDRVFELTGTISLAIVTLGLTYFGATTVLGTREVRRDRRRAAGLPSLTASECDQLLARYTTYFLVPALDEEAVIEATVGALATNPNVTVVVVDDASDDRTAELAHAAGRDQVMVVTRTLPEARMGKGPALNAGFRAVVDDAQRRELDPERTLVCVMDADGRLSDEALAHVYPLFDNDAVGGVQLAVRIRNRGRLLTTLQDFEFWGLSAVSQLARRVTSSVSLGGNGQFTRLTALVALDEDPWSQSLTEDLDLAVTLLLAGWQLTTTPSAYVDQQGVESLRLLVRQRTRWFQGHMSCASRIPDVWSSPRLGHWTALEVTLYLLVPFLLVLPWSIIFHIGVAQVLLQTSGPPALSLLGSAIAGRIVMLLAWYFLSFAPSLVGGYLYYRRDRQVGRIRALALGHLLVPANYIAYVSCWRAVGRMVRGRRGWDKTSRSIEAGEGVDAAEPVEVPVEVEVASA